MRFTETDLKGLWLIEREPHSDSRGSFARTFCEREFAAHGLETRFVQHSQSLSREKATVRGMHFQKEPHAEVKLVSCIAGAILDVAVDLRPGSPGYLSWRAFELTPGNGRQIYIPEGFAHGFQTLTDDAVVHYLISEFHAPPAASGVRYDDPALGIEWPLPPGVVADKDRAWPLIESASRPKVLAEQ
ncbi:MAG TPA: dTDP-4-dehydrorhamnose 3,5-epimerase, partial [Pararhizobium sp.]|nr:dTDP-4-dehydrorhamnose 3,5-epimerase [Pararhizobium sp.]